MRTRLTGAGIAVYFTAMLLLLLGVAMVGRDTGNAPAPAPVGVTIMPTPDPARYVPTKGTW